MSGSVYPPPHPFTQKLPGLRAGYPSSRVCMHVFYMVLLQSSDRVPRRVHCSYTSWRTDFRHLNLMMAARFRGCVRWTSRGLNDDSRSLFDGQTCSLSQFFIYQRFIGLFDCVSICSHDCTIKAYLIMA